MLIDAYILVENDRSGDRNTRSRSDILGDTGTLRTEFP